MQTFKKLFSYTAVLLGFAAFAFLAPSCSDSDEPDNTPVAATGIEITPSTLSMMVGTSKSIVVSVKPANATDRSYTLVSSNPSVATVKDNRVTGVAVGEATITATSNDGDFEAACTVTVKTADPTLINLNSFTQGVLLFYGTNYGTAGLSYNWRIQLAGPTYDVVNLVGKGGALMFELNTDLSSTMEIAPGLYTMLDKDKTEASTLLPFTAIPGMLDATQSEPIGAWYLYSEEEGGTPDATNDIESGTVEVSKNDDTYTLKFSFLDEDENILFKGTYTGVPIYIDVTKPQQQ